MRIGVLGFAEQGWMDLFSARVDTSKIRYERYMEAMPKLSRELREKHGCEFIIALTHMHAPEDFIMAKNAKPGELDMILGGHDHLFLGNLVRDTDVYMHKSGTDFEAFSNLSVLFGVS